MPAIRNLAAALGALLLLGGAKETGTVRTWIALEAEAEGAQRFVAYASADRKFLGRYELSGEKHSGTGKSRVQQAGRVVIAPDAPVRLTELSFGKLQGADHYTVQLRMFEQDRLVGEAILTR